MAPCGPRSTELSFYANAPWHPLVSLVPLGCVREPSSVTQPIDPPIPRFSLVRCFDHVYEAPGEY